MKSKFLCKSGAYGLVFLLLALLSTAQQSGSRISGNILLGADKKPAEGATVQILPGNRSVLTDLNGKFSFEKNDAKTIRVSYVGFATAELAIGSQSTLVLTLQSVAGTTDEVVVVGYGQQKKVNLTGSVQTVKFQDAVNQPVTNSAQLMYGKFSGVQLTQGSGLPGSDNSSILIRGVGTFGASTPLVIIDNIQYNSLAEFNNLSPSDIESITVLKDASASAIYGSRGANGVILVSTKTGKKGKNSFEYNNYFGFQRATVVPDYLDAVTYAQFRNERDLNANGPTAPIRYDAAAIDAIKTGSKPDQYAQTKWSDVILRDAPIQQHYVSFSGGGDATTFRISAGYLSQDAIVNGKFKNNRYSLGVNLTNRTTNWLALSFNSNTFWARFTGPSGGPDAIGGETGIINQFQRSAPTVPVYYSNGNYGFVDGAYQNVNYSFPINNALFRGLYGDYSNDNINTSNRLGLTATFLKDFSFEVSGSANINTNNTSNFNPTRTDYDWAGNVVNPGGNNSLSNNYSVYYRLQNEDILRYQKTLGDHKISALAGYSAMYDRNDGFSASAQNFATNTLQEFDAGGGLVAQTVGGNASEVTWTSYFGRVNYAFRDKYLLEANLRRDGSSRFGPENKYGNFPSVSAGWNVSKEKFMKNIKSISYLKLRGSWGRSGNDRIGNYLFDQTLATGLDYTVGADVSVGAIAATVLANPKIHWETTEQFDVGVDVGLFNNKLSIEADYFQRKSYDVLYNNFPIPATSGFTTLAVQNSASMLNEGVEVNASYRTNFGKLKMTLGGNVTYMKDNKVTDLGPDARETVGNQIIRVGVPYNAYFGYKQIGIFQTTDEVTNSPKQFGSSLTKPGDMKYADISGPTGKADGVVDQYDRVVIGNPYPTWMYGFNALFEYKGFDLNASFQGVGKLDRVLMNNGQQPMPDDRNNALSYWVGRWTPTSPSQTLPRLGGVNNSQFSTFYINDVSYLRLRNLEIGYSLPAAIGKKASIQRLRIFVSAQNLLTITKLENFDPERATGTSSDLNVPLYKIFTTGINLKF